MDFHPRKALLLVLAASTLLFCTGLGATDFWAPDEPRYGQVAEELRSMDQGLEGLVLLHLGGEPYTQKPPLYYWLAAGIGSGAGRVTEAAARLPSALAGVATAGLTYALGRRLFATPGAALLASALLLTSFRFAHLARRAQLDVLLTCFETLALLAFWRIDERARHGSAEPPHWGWVLLLHAALGAAALTKGPVGWLPVVVFAAYLAWEGRLPLLRQLAPPWALLVSVGPILVWIWIATALAPTGFFAEAVLVNVLGRVVDASSHVRPTYYYLYQLPLDFLPWTLLWPLAWRAARAAKWSHPEAARPWRLLVLWVAVPLVLFSLASGKRGLYLLPAFPALALLCGQGLDRWRAAGADVPRGLLAAAAGLALAAAAAAAAGWARQGFEWSRFPGFGISAEAGVVIGLTAVLGACAVLAASRGGRAAVLAAVVATVLALELAAFHVVYPDFDAEKSPRSVARLAAGLTTADERVGIFDDEGLAGGILYYGQRRVAVLPRPPQVQRFLDDGGRYVVLERWKLPWLEPVGEFRVHATTRRSRRELAIVALAP